MIIFFRISQEIESTIQIHEQDAMVIQRLKHFLSIYLDQRFPISAISICGFLLDPSQLKIDITRYLVQHGLTKESALSNMIRKFGIDCVGRSHAPGVLAASLTPSTPVSTTTPTTPVSSPSLKRRFPLESSGGSGDDRSIKKIRENLIHKHSASIETTVDSVAVEIENYLKIDLVCDDVLRFWQTSNEKFPRLAALARIVLAIPCTSTPSEQVFSTTGLIMNSKRTTLAPENVGKIQLIHDNYDLFRT